MILSVGEEEEVSIKDVALSVAKAAGLKDSQIKVRAIGSKSADVTRNGCIHCIYTV